MEKLDNIQRILIVNLGGIGDIILSTPALKALRACYADSKIDMLAVPRAAELAKNVPYLDDVYVFDKNILCALGNLSVLLALRMRRYDIVINMRTLVSAASARKMKILMEIIHPRLKAGWDTDGFGHFFDIKIPETFLGEKYEAEYNIDMAVALGAKVVDHRPEFLVSEKEEKAAGELLKSLGIKDSDQLIVINPGGHSTRRWPAERFASVIRGLYQKNSNCRFLITGSKEEKPLASMINSLCGVPVIDCCGRFGVKALGAVIKRCNLCITNDTGPLHIAAALGVPLIAIFGPGDLTRFDPRNISDKAAVFFKKAECWPCTVKSCSDPRCLKAVSIDEVLEAALKWIS